MKRVFKYDIKGGVHTMSLPAGAQVLSVQHQETIPTEMAQLWALVDDEETEYEIRSFLIAGTGHSISHKIKSFINTFKMADDRLIFHVFEVENGG